MAKAQAITPDTEQAVAELAHMSVGRLREKYLELFGEPSRSGNRQFLFKRLAWRVQSLAEGGLSERARRRAEELARDADLRTTLPKPPGQRDGNGKTVTLPAPPAITSRGRLPVPGTVLSRTYRGSRVEVKVLPSGFEHDGQVYRSLSAAAKAVTGSHCSGHLFFGLKGRKGRD